MAMSVGTGGEEEGGAISEINTTPLVDIMLVLLIIFLITVPVVRDMARVEIPKAVNIPTQTKPENITISVDKSGTVFWNTSRGSSPAVGAGTGGPGMREESNSAVTRRNRLSTPASEFPLDASFSESFLVSSPVPAERASPRANVTPPKRRE